MIYTPTHGQADAESLAVRKLNDEHRLLCPASQIVYSPDILEMDEKTRREIFLEVRFYTAFNYYHDRNHEHDYGFFTHNNNQYRWYIDYVKINNNPVDSTRRGGCARLLHIETRQQLGLAMGF